ncbi:tRNA (adenosine(37)-N6)-threonylcarbamoyltransferase complex ATPase subunit type 1 TsaE [Wenzhouxiangella sediminis]|jgi:tRNA threonylcarbamoyladenosine biosynthesis protein TsaE|uniref:tRNA threonylcarbamoyladenosine biosynthesis protein TsaE n=1 Tax=Wenzhouxiangella sediminis TaxID=1792836 RepID=A0A3E1KCV8_9GAMM|nr:tRNA (adenosine(37)-N6)-threonylcarbamoyltransferase complex ATPase subunit type 1 TsaE [Wenzhouxiangella sediminis]RFF32877.1 tRNA (adenosine(37)-N6)-threonylcarbamoyltransferase complex ATPase subunit type 1 TsaE [Wenzhouxiangella sediminis]
MNQSRTFEPADESGTMALGAELAELFAGGGIVYLSGDLGAGKTTLVRGLLRALGFSGRVKSPSYGLIESYTIDGRDIHHLDLYRLGHGEEIAYLGLEDLLSQDSLLLVEWPERGEGWLPAPDWRVRIDDRAGGGRSITVQQTKESTQSA